MSEELSKLCPSVEPDRAVWIGSATHVLRMLVRGKVGEHEKRAAYALLTAVDNERAVALDKMPARIA